MASDFSKPAEQLVASVKEELKRRDIVLPALPDLAQRVRRAIDDPDTHARELARLISVDPAISGRLIQVANSPLFRGLQHTETVDGAVTRLGFICVRNLVVSLSMYKLFNISGKPWVKDKVKACWQQSTLVGAYSEVMAKRFTQLEPSEALLGGMLHNIGALPALMRCGKSKQLQQRQDLVDPLVHEMAPELGEWILENWNLSERLNRIPVEYRDMTRSHEGPADYTDVVQVAKLHVSRKDKNDPLHEVEWPRVPAFEKLGLTPEGSIEAMREAHADVQETLRILQSKQ